MAYSCCSGNFSSRSLRSCLSSSRSCSGSSYPSNLVYTTTSCSPSPCQLSSSLNSGCQETGIEPTSCQRTYVVSSPCQKPCYYPGSSTPCSPCQGTYAGSLGFGSSRCRSRSCYPVGCGSSGFRPLNCEVYGFPSLSYGSRFYYPTYLAYSSCQPCYRTICGSGICGINC